MWRDAGMRDLGELTGLTRGELLRVPNMWAGTVVALERALARYGLALASGEGDTRCGP